MIIDGKALARDSSIALAKEIQNCPGITLGIFMIAPTEETKSFVRIKKKKAAELGVSVIEETLPSEVSTEAAAQMLMTLIEKVDGVVIQKPLPEHIDTEVLCNLLPKEKDIDALTDSSPYMSPVAGAVQEIFSAYNIDPKGMKAVVVGSGVLVGKPVTALLKERGAHVTVMTKDTGVNVEAMKKADIIISGAGKPGLITKNMLQQSAIVIDAGTSESNGAMVGDVDSECYEYVYLISPVPGGVGPLTVISLFKNLYKSASCSS